MKLVIWILSIVALFSATAESKNLSIEKSYNPANPVRKSAIHLDCLYDRSYNWAISGNLAIGTARECGMGIYDIGSPGNPKKLVLHNPDENSITRSPNATSEISLEDVEIRNNRSLRYL